MEREARHRQFMAADKRAFLGDGQAWNWSLQQAHFPDFVPILDFIHVLTYLYRASLALRSQPAEVWSCYSRLATACWQGRAQEVTDALQAWLSEQGLAAAELEASDPRQAVIDAARYLTNNLSRMHYPDYRRAGLPLTSALMESLVKEVNYRVKGTEMFWNDPAGAILSWRGWALHDRQTGLFERLPLAPLPNFLEGGLYYPVQGAFDEPFVELDGRAGWYAAGEWRHLDRSVVRAIHYDNRGDPTVVEDGQWAWWTRFDRIARGPG